MPKNVLPIGILFMVLVVLMAGVGISYGWWTDDLALETSITMGDLDVFWSGYEGDTGCGVSRSSGLDTLFVTVSDAYPGFECTVTVGVKNASSMAVDVIPDLTPVKNTLGDLEPFLDVDWTDPCDGIMNMAPNATETCTAVISVSEDLEDYQGETGEYDLRLVAHQHEEGATTP